MGIFWKSLVRRISNGAPVDESVSNRPIDDLADRTEWLRRRVEAISKDSGRLMMNGVPVDPASQIGHWMFYDPGTDSYRPALARMETTGISMPRPAASALVSGILVDKTGPSEGSILMAGEASVGDGGVVQVPSMAYLVEEGEEFEPGEHFLSASQPGRMTRFPAGAPAVRLGAFSETRMQVMVSARTLHDGHVHHRFALDNAPSSRKWDLVDDGESPAVVEEGFVDYADDPAHRGKIQIGVSVTPGMVWDGVRRRIRIRKSGSAMVVESSRLSWLGTETPESSVPVQVPAYGARLDLVAGEGEARKTGVSVSFVRPGFRIEGPSAYGNSLADDFSTEVPDGTGWVVDLPDHLSGWTNCCEHVESWVPPGSVLRYVSEGQADLASILPTSPLGSGILTVSGTDAAGSWDRSAGELFWTDGNAKSGTWGLPWDEAYDPDDPSTFSRAFLHVQSSPHGDSDPVVRSLHSGSPMFRLRAHGTEKDASTGALVIDFDYRPALDEDEEPSPEGCLSGISKDGRSLLGGTRISKITPGPNILVRKVMPDGELSGSGTHSGHVRIDLASVEAEGAAPSFSLFNAKESERNGISYIEFLPPSQAATAAVARIPVPSSLQVPDGQSLAMEARTQWMGTSSGGGSAYLAVMRTEIRVVRPGVNLASSMSSPSEVMASGIEISDDYPAFRVMPDISVSTGMPPESIAPGDQVFLRFSREANSPPFQVGPAASLEDNSVDPDDYPGRVALVSTRWRFFSV